MGRTTWIRTGLWLLAALVLLCMSTALAVETATPNMVSQGELFAEEASNSNGNMPVVDATVPNTVVRGQFLEIKVNNAAAFQGEGYANQWLHAEAHDVNSDRWCGCYFWDGKGTILLPTAELDAGEYELHVRAGAEGWNESENIYTFSVTEPEKGKIVFAIDKTAVLTCEGFNVTIYAPGAESIRIFEDGWEIKRWEGSLYQGTHGRGTKGKRWLRAEAYYAAEKKWVSSDEIVVNITAPDGDITAKNVNVQMDNCRLNAGEDLKITWVNERNYRVDVEVIRLGEQEEDVWRSWYENGETTMTVPVKMPEGVFENVDCELMNPGDTILEAGEFYRVYVTFSRMGSNSLSVEQNFVVLSEEMFEEGFELRVNGTTEDVEVPVNTNFEVRVTAPEGATAIQIWNGCNWEFFDECAFSEDRELQTGWMWGDVNRRLFTARYTKTENPGESESVVWSKLSNIVSVTTTATGSMPVIDASFPQTVARGQFLEIKVNNPSDFEGYAGLQLDAEPYSPEDDHWYGRYGWDGVDTILLPTAELKEGRTYQLRVRASAPGYLESESKYRFTVTSPGENIFAGNVYWKFSTDKAVPHQGVYFSAYATNTEVAHIRVEIIREESGDSFGGWDGNRLAADWIHLDQAGSYTFMAYLYREGEEEPFAQSSRIIKVTADGTLAPVQVEIPKTITLKQSLRGSIVPVDGAQWYSLSLSIDRGDCWEWFEDHDQEADNTAIDYAGQWFDEVGLYRLSVGAHAVGMNSSYAMCYVVVNPETNQVVSLSLGCETETLNCVAHTELPMVVIAPGALEVEYFGGHEWWNINDRESEIGYVGSESFDGGDYTAMARARFEEEGEWVYSNPVIVHASMTDGLGASTLTVPDIVARGEPLVVSFTAVENASQYNVHIVNEDGQGYGYGFEPGIHRLDTSVLEAGTYRLIVNYCGSGYAWRSVEKTFTVTGDAPEEIQTFLGADKIACNEKVLVSVYAPGANRIRIYERDAFDDEEWLYEECEGDTYTHNFHRDHPATVRYSASVSYDGGENWSDRVEIGELRVIESSQLAKPTIELPSSTISEGEDVAFSFQPVENAAIYWYSLRDNGIMSGRDGIMDGWFDYPADVELPASLFRAGHTYRLDVLVGAPGYETSDAAYTLAVLPNAQDIGATLTVNGGDESAEGWVTDDFRVEVVAPGATGIVVSDGLDRMFQAGNHFENDFHYENGGELVLIARYTTDPIDGENPDWENVSWAGYSNPVTLRILSNGYMPAVKANVPASVTRSDFMEIAITNKENFLNVEEGKYGNLWLHAEAYSPDEDRWYGCYDWDGEGTIMLPTAELEAGTYELHVRAGADGYVGSTSVYKFSVNAPENDAIRFVIDKTEVVTGEDFTIFIYAPGADQVKLFEGYGEIDCRDGDTYVQRHSHGEATELRFHAEAHMPETDAWVKTEPITVTVTAPGGSITAAELGLVMPTRLEADKELTIAWNDLGLQHYDVEIVRLRDDVRVWHSWNDHGETAVTVPAMMPEKYEGMESDLDPGDPILQAGEFYRVNLYFQRYGYNSLHIEKQIVVVSDDMYAQGLTLMVDGKTDEYATLVNVDVPVRITAPQNATAILAWNGYDWEMCTGNEVAFTWAWGDANERLVYARYTTQEIEEGKDWTKYGWNRVSNIVSVNVTRNGYVEAPVVTLSSATPLRGEALSFTVSNPESGFNWTVYDPVDDWSWDWSDWEEKTSHEINTFDLQVNRTYLLCVDKYGSEGYEGTGVEIPFTVGAADKIYDGNVLELPTGLKAIEEEAFAGISARTVVIPEGCTSIGSRAFADCGSLKYVVIPDSVTSIAENAFAGSNVTFVCNDDSPAHAYAQERGIPTRSHD